MTPSALVAHYIAVIFYWWYVHVASAFSTGSTLSGGSGIGSIIGCIIWENQLAMGWYANNLEKIYFEGNLCYSGSLKMIWPKQERPFSGLNLGWDVSKPFFDRGGQGCGIISAIICPYGRVPRKSRICLIYMFGGRKDSGGPIG
jgi:hypothetical protein